MRVLSGRHRQHFGDGSQMTLSTLRQGPRVDISQQKNCCAVLNGAGIGLEVGHQRLETLYLGRDARVEMV